VPSWPQSQVDDHGKDGNQFWYILSTHTPAGPVTGRGVSSKSAGDAKRAAKTVLAANVSTAMARWNRENQKRNRRRKW